MVGSGIRIKTMMLLLIVATAMPLGARTIDVTTDRQQVAVNESFNIVFSAEGAVDGDPDFSPLEKNFQILSTSQSSNFSLINGELERSKTWTLTVLPRHSGNLTIPAIAFGSDTSPRASVQVEAAGTDQEPDDQGEIFLRAEVEPASPYVQSRVLYTLKLYRSVPTSNAVLNDPEVTEGDAVIERMGDDKTYLTRVNGQRYRVVERRFAVYPQTSGTLSIGPVEFRGHVSGSSRSLFDPFGPRAEMVVRRSGPVTMEVRPIPEEYNGRHWLPAQEVTLAEEWSRDPDQFRVGEPITRTLILKAKGQTASQLPELPASLPDGFRQYPDQPELETESGDAGVVGIRRESTALIPRQAGDHTLPAVRIPWWNTRSDEMEYAVLPERTVTVAAAAGETGKDIGEAGPAPLGEPAPPQPEGEPADEPRLAEQASTPENETESSIWLYLTVALVVIWLLTLAAWWFSFRRRKISAAAGGESRRRVLRALKGACMERQPRRAREHLLQWGRLTWPDDPPLNPLEAGRRLDPELEDAVTTMNDVLYSNHAEQWDGEAFWQSFESAIRKRQGDKKGEAGKLEPLYRL